MPPKASIGDRLLLLTLTLEAAVQAENWSEVSEILAARASILDESPKLSEKVLKEIGEIEERALTTLRRRLLVVQGDIRNLSTALRIAAPYARSQARPTFSLAG